MSTSYTAGVARSALAYASTFALTASLAMTLAVAPEALRAETSQTAEEEVGSRAPTLDASGAALETAAAEFRTVPREYRFDGVVEAVNETTISAQTQGQIQEIHFDVDNFVDEGDLIAKLNDTQHRARVAQASADLKSSSAQLKRAKDEYDRIEGLFKRKNVSASAMDAAEADLKAAQAAVEVSTANLEQAQEQLAYTEIIAPYAGIVIDRHMEIGEIARPGEPIMTGISLEQLRVSVDVPQGVIPAVRELGEVQVYLPNGEMAEVASLTVFPYADPKSSTFTVRVELAERDESLYPGMFVKTGVTTGKKEELTIPSSAVVNRSEISGVYIINDGRLSFAQIRTGRDHGDRTVVLSGLNEGDQVAVDPVAAGAALRAQIAQRATAQADAGHD